MLGMVVLCPRIGKTREQQVLESRVLVEMLRCLEPGWRKVWAVDTKVGRESRAEPGVLSPWKLLCAPAGGRGGARKPSSVNFVHRNPYSYGPHREEEGRAVGTEQGPGRKPREDSGASGFSSKSGHQP